MAVISDLGYNVLNGQLMNFSSVPDLPSADSGSMVNSSAPPTIRGKRKLSLVNFADSHCSPTYYSDEISRYEAMDTGFHLNDHDDFVEDGSSAVSFWI